MLAVREENLYNRGMIMFERGDLTAFQVLMCLPAEMNLQN